MRLNAHPSPSGEGGLGRGSGRAGWGDGAERRILHRRYLTPVGCADSASPEGEECCHSWADEKDRALTS